VTYLGGLSHAHIACVVHAVRILYSSRVYWRRASETTMATRGRGNREVGGCRRHVQSYMSYSVVISTFGSGIADMPFGERRMLRCLRILARHTLTGVCGDGIARTFMTPAPRLVYVCAAFCGVCAGGACIRGEFAPYACLRGIIGLPQYHICSHLFYLLTTTASSDMPVAIYCALGDARQPGA